MQEEIIRITVDEVLEEVKKYQGNFDPDGLCIYFANNIGSLLDEQEIAYKKLVISDYIDTDYYHEFIITMPNEQGKSFLIDPSYSQFTPKDKNLTRFKEWPLNVLKNTNNGNVIANELLKNGLCQTDEQGIKTYLASFDVDKEIEEIDFNFDKLKSKSK